ncbi:MAG: hypothetical protein HKN62_11395 [Phycisphaerales bacterium]|nr:hypothetical protein [Phycisphaerales bacterium]
MFCRRCRYDLHHLRDGTCPECGTPFDAADTRTFHAVPHAPRLGVVILVAWALGVFAFRWLLLLVEQQTPGWLQPDDWVVALLLLGGPVAAGWRADFSIPHLLYGAVFALVLIVADELALLDWLFDLHPLPISLLLTLLGVALTGMMLGCRLIGKTTWRWRNRRRALAALRPPRPRPAWRRHVTAPRVAFGLLTLVVLVAGWLTFELDRLIRSQPNVAVNYHERLLVMFERVTNTKRRDAHAAWESLVETIGHMETVRQEHDGIYREAGFEARDQWDDGGSDFSFALRAHDDLTVTQREQDTMATLADAGVFARLDAFAAGPIGYRPATSTADPNPPMLNTQLPMLAPMRQLARTQAAAMRFATEDGDFAAVARHFDSLMALAETLTHQRTFIDWLVAAAILSLGVDELGHELVEADFDEAACVRLLRTLETRRIASIAHPMEGERASFYDTVQRTFTDDGQGDGYCHPGLTRLLLGGMAVGGGGGGPGFLAAPRAAFRARFVLAPRRVQVERYDGVMDVLMSEARLAPYERWTGAHQPSDFETAVSPRLHLAATLMPNAAYLRSDGPLRSQLAGVRVLVALELYHARRGQWPRTLAELTPEILPSVPVDPLTGTPFGYRRHDDVATHPFRLYSYGVDGVDHGGVFESRRPAAGWAPGQGGVDVPFVRERRSW